MKYIALTFDDGRSDNFSVAKCIMDKYKFRGTVYITTGFVDGTWEGKDVLRSPTRALNIDEITNLHESNWEIGLHGDKHQTQVDDMRVVLNKLKMWGVEKSSWGISVPNSVTDESEISKIFASDYGNEIDYVRRGRKCDTTQFSNRLLYALYSIFHAKSAYCKFNLPNVFLKGDENKANIPSVVIKANDDPKIIFDFIKKIPENYVVVFMLHSILPSEHPSCGKDPWSWNAQKFDFFCACLKNYADQGNVVVAPLAEILKG